MTDKTITEIFGEPISVYSSQQAVEDGVLVAVSKQDAVTRTVWDWLTTKTPMDSQPPSCWPVEMMGWFRAGGMSKKEALKFIAKHGMEAQKKYEQKIRDDKALALSKGLIGKYERQAKAAEFDEGHTFEIHVQENDERILRVVEAGSPGTVPLTIKTLYLRPNDCGGVTLMFPEDN